MTWPWPGFAAYWRKLCSPAFPVAQPESAVQPESVARLPRSGIAGENPNGRGIPHRTNARAPDKPCFSLRPESVTFFLNCVVNALQFHHESALKRLAKEKPEDALRGAHQYRSCKRSTPGA